jgi:hypothetical protein
MLPGYVSNDELDPYLSPIYISSVQPLKIGKALLRLKFINAAYAQGVRDTDITVRVLMRGSSYMFSELLAAQKHAIRRYWRIEFRLAAPALSAMAGPRFPGRRG